MYLNMPGLNGLEVTKRIMETAPVPIIIVTSDTKSAANPFHLLEAGAVAVLRSPAPPGHPDHEQTAAQLIKTIKALAGVKLVRPSERRRESARITSTNLATGSGARCIAIGASTGGPQVLRHILCGLPADFSLPVLVTQHIAKGFTTSLVKWLNGRSPLTLSVAEQGERIEPGHVYVAPDDRHMGVSARMLIELSESNEYTMRPSISYMFKSIERSFGKNSIAILLTGMGRDGAAEMAVLKAKGALTIAQDRESSLIHGMPAEAIAFGGVCEVLSPDKIVERLLSIGAPSSKSTVSGWLYLGEK
jgi:two-component system chemotaxis response regulator CheB